MVKVILLVYKFPFEAFGWAIVFDGFVLADICIFILKNNQRAKLPFLIENLTLKLQPIYSKTSCPLILSG